MQRTLVVLAFFVAALLAGVFLNYINTNLPAAAPVSKDKEHFAQREVGMPLDMQSSGVTGFSSTSPILGSEPKPVSEKPYEMANDQELFQFEGNRVSADCCPSPFSSGGGCVCLTDAQINEFASRGGNRA